jgi:hypothetical protein
METQTCKQFLFVLFSANFLPDLRGCPTSPFPIRDRGSSSGRRSRSGQATSGRTNPKSPTAQISLARESKNVKRREYQRKKWNKSEVKQRKFQRKKVKKLSCVKKIIFLCLTTFYKIIVQNIFSKQNLCIFGSDYLFRCFPIRF